MQQVYKNASEMELKSLFLLRQKCQFDTLHVQLLLPKQTFKEQVCLASGGKGDVPLVQSPLAVFSALLIWKKMGKPWRKKQQDT